MPRTVVRVAPLGPKRHDVNMTPSMSDGPSAEEGDEVVGRDW
jgi:hypothetical protein